MEMVNADVYDQPARETVQALLQKHRLHAKKSWGQNFLVNDAVYQAIVAACDLGPNDPVIEVGAGLGTLTARLLQTGAPVVAIEREAGMCHVLKEELGSHSTFRLIEEDAMQTDYGALCSPMGKPVTLVGNLPYYISAPLLFRFLEARSFLRRIVIMLQKEVADRLCANPDTDAYGALSAQVQMLADVRRVCRVGSGSFIPTPKVESAVVQISPLAGTRVPVLDLAVYQRVVQAAFSQRRKTMRNALRSVFPDCAEVALEQAGIQSVRRGETLSIAEFARLSDAVHLLCR